MKKPVNLSTHRPSIFFIKNRQLILGRDKVQEFLRIQILRQ